MHARLAFVPVPLPSSAVRRYSAVMRVFLVTGASSGIGAATARAVAAPQTALVLHARKNRSGLEKVAAEAKAAGAGTLIVEGDLAVAGTATGLVEEATK